VREIEFRGIAEHDGRRNWVYGFYLKSAARDGNVRHHIVEEDGLTYDIDPETRGEYTGLKDKNGARIFEGDIVSFGGDKYRIIFDDACFWINSVRDAGYSMELHTLLGQGDIEVIGNIHDSPELLQASDG